MCIKGIMEQSLPTIDREFDSSKKRTPEERLLIAFLMRTIKDIFDIRSTIAFEALGYILSEEDENIEWSFRWVCVHLDIEPSKLTKLLMDNRNNLMRTGIFQLVQNR